MGRQSQLGHPVLLSLLALLFMGAAFAPLPFQTSLNTALEETVTLELPVPEAVLVPTKQAMTESPAKEPARDVLHQRFLVSRLIATSA